MKNIVLILSIILLTGNLYARDASRDLKRMVGYIIVIADSVSEIIETKNGEKHLKLTSGEKFKIDFLLLDPLVLTDVIIFAKAPSKELLEKFKDKLPEKYLYSYKALIENEVFDITPL